MEPKNLVRSRMAAMGIINRKKPNRLIMPKISFHSQIWLPASMGSSAPAFSVMPKKSTT